LTESIRDHPAIRLVGVSKSFYYYRRPHTTLRSGVIGKLSAGKSSRPPEPFEIRDLNLEVARGESVALVGSNGSGKSTLLRLISGIYKPSRGRIETSGQVRAVIELGAGFHPELSGEENVSLYSAVLGMTRSELADNYDSIVEFADIRGVMETPLKYYSSGMKARLAFAVAICLNPDVLMLDEVLAVGDLEFRERCRERLRNYSREGGTMIMVSHELDRLPELCSRAIWLENGQVVMSDTVETVLEAFRSHSS